MRYIGKCKRRKRRQKKKKEMKWKSERKKTAHKAVNRRVQKWAKREYQNETSDLEKKSVRNKCDRTWV